MLGFRSSFTFMLVLIFVLAAASSAFAATPTVEQLAETVASMQQTIASQQAQINSLQTSLDLALANSAAADPASPMWMRVEQLNLRLNMAQSVLDLAPYVRVSQDATNGVAAPNVTLSGVNLFIQDGGQPGRGNLILGYDAPRDSWAPEQLASMRTGSHTLVIGDGHSWTGPSGIVNGWANTLGDGGGSILGGDSNSVNSSMGVIVGGARNLIDSPNQDNIIAGGFGNRIIDATAFGAICGGQSNTISGSSPDSVICGGGQNEIHIDSGKGGVGMISGGFSNVINSERVNPTLARTGDWGYPSTCDAISGGNQNKISAGWANVISGGSANLASADNAGTVSGGHANAVGACYDAQLHVRSSGSYATIGGGDSHALAGEALWSAGTALPTK